MKLPLRASNRNDLCAVRFFRISLSKGQDWIPLEKELRHVDDYLKILQIRYGRMLSYTIEDQTVSPELQVLKMVLQPLVENAVYHGTKFVRRVGMIRITVSELLSQDSNDHQ